MIIQIHVDLLAPVIDKYGGVCKVFQILLLIFSVFFDEQQDCWTPLTVAQGVSHQFTQFHYKHNVHKLLGPHQLNYKIQSVLGNNNIPITSP